MADIEKTEVAEQPAMTMSGMKAYTVFSSVFCVTLIVSNVLAAKTLDLGLFQLPASIMTFPLVYVINDVLSEVFGFKQMRKTIFLGFFMAFFASLAFTLGIYAPGLRPDFDAAFAMVLGNSGRILIACYCSYLAGSMLNSYLMNSLKQRFNGLFFRCIFSTFLGELVDSCMFITVAFWGIYEPTIIFTMIGSQVLFKTTYEIVAYPLTKQVIAKVRSYSFG